MDALLSEWLGWRPNSGRSSSIQRAIRNKEILVAANKSEIVGFIHFALHEDIIDGAPDAFITAFYIRGRHRGNGVGNELLRRAVIDATKRGATFIETSTLHPRAKGFYEGFFWQIFGEISEVFLELGVSKYPDA